MVISLLASGFLGYTYVCTNDQLQQTNTKLTSKEEQQEATVAKLADTENALKEMTEKQENTAATLSATETKLADTENALKEMTDKQENTAATLSATETKLADTENALKEMTDKQENTAATLSATETKLADTENALKKMTDKQENTAATLSTTETKLADTEAELKEIMDEQAATAAALEEQEAELTKLKEEYRKLKSATQNTNSSLGATDEIKAEEIDLSGSQSSEYKVLKEYEWNVYDYHYLALVVRNTSGADKAVRAQVLFYDDTDKLIGACDLEQSVCGNENIAFLWCCCETVYARYEYTIELKDSYCKDSTSSIVIDSTINPRNAILMIKNISEVTPNALIYYCLFFDSNDQIIEVYNRYADSPAPGKSKFDEIKVYEDFERIEVYYVAYTY